MKYLQVIVFWKNGIKILNPDRIMLLFKQQNSKIMLETGQQFFPSAHSFSTLEKRMLLTLSACQQAALTCMMC